MSEFISILERIRPGYKVGGVVTTLKRGLVDGPGSYAGFKQVTDKEFIELYKEFQSLDNLGTDSEFVDFLNKKRIKPGTLGDPRLYSKNERFTTRTASGRRQRLNLKTKVKPYVSPKKQAEVARINKVIQKEVNIANKGNKYISPADISFKVEDQLGIKPYFLDRINAQGKKIKVRSAALKPNSYPAIRNLDSMITKVDNVLKEMLISEEPLNDYFYKELSKRTGIEQKTLTKIRNDVPTYKVIADQGANKLLKVVNAPYLKKLNLSQQLVEGLEMQKGLPRFVNTEEGVKYITRPKANVMQFARRSWNNNKGQGEIKFFDKNGKLIKWERGLELPYKNVSFSYGGKKYNVSNLTPSLVQKDFPEVKKVTEAANKLRTTEIDNPFKPGKKTTVNSLIRKIQIEGYKWKPTLGTINILHGPEGVANKPFTDLTYNTRDINQLEAGFTSSLKAGNISETQYKKVIKELYKPFVKGDADKAIIDRITKQAQQIEKGKFYGFDELKEQIKATGIKPTDIKNVKNFAEKKGFVINNFAGALNLSQANINIPPSVRKSLTKIVRAGKTLGKAAVVIDPLFAAMDFSKAMGEGLSGKESASYTGQKFFQDIANLPRTLEDLAYVATDKGTFKNFGEKENRLFSYEPAAFADRYIQEKIEATPEATKDFRKARIDYAKTLPIIDDMDIPMSQSDAQERERAFYIQRGVEPPEEETDFTYDGIMSIVPPKGVI